VAVFVHNPENQELSVDDQGCAYEVPVHRVAARTAACLYLNKNPQLVMDCIDLIANQLPALIAKEHWQADPFAFLLARLDPVAEFLEPRTQTSEDAVACKFGNG